MNNTRIRRLLPRTTNANGSSTVSTARRREERNKGTPRPTPHLTSSGRLPYRRPRRHQWSSPRCTICEIADDGNNSFTDTRVNNISLMNGNTHTNNNDDDDDNDSKNTRRSLPNTTRRQLPQDYKAERASTSMLMLRTTVVLIMWMLFGLVLTIPRTLVAVPHIDMIYVITRLMLLLGQCR